MKHIILLVFLFFPIVIHSQTIQERENNLRSLKIDEVYGRKMNQARELLKIDKFNRIAIDYILRAYYNKKKIKAITAFFTKLIKDNQGNALPYYIRSQLGFYEDLSDQWETEYLQKAYAIDSMNVNISYDLAKTWYQRFNKGFIAHKQKDTLEVYAKNAMKGFIHSCGLNDSLKIFLKYPVIQLAHYLQDDLTLKKLEHLLHPITFFPVIPMSGLPSNWETDYHQDVIYAVEEAKLFINWYTKQLQGMGEESLYDSKPANIFRFTWLPSFHHPIVIGMINRNDTVTLYWKMSDGKGGYDPGKLIINASKRLSINEWNNFTKKIDSIGFWELNTKSKKMPGMDGAEWILEGKELNTYHVVDRWEGGDIGSLCYYLRELTNMKIEGEDHD